MEDPPGLCQIRSSMACPGRSRIREISRCATAEVRWRADLCQPCGATDCAENDQQSRRKYRHIAKQVCAASPSTRSRACHRRNQRITVGEGRMRKVRHVGPCPSTRRTFDSPARRLACQPKLANGIRLARLRQGYGGQPSRDSERRLVEAAGVGLDRGSGSGRFCKILRKNNRLKTVDPLENRVGPP